MVLRLGNVERVFADAEHVVETTFRISDGPTAPATTLAIKSAVTTDGRITAQRCVVSRTGTADHRERIEAGLTAPYDIDTLEIDTGPLGGDDLPRLVWAHESHTDMLARRLGLDPFDLRRRNIPPDGTAASVLTRLEQRMGWRGPVERGTPVIRRGRGVAIGVRSGTMVASGAAVEVDTATGATRLIRLVTVTERDGRLDDTMVDSLDLDAGPVSSAALAGDAIPALAETITLAVAPAIANAIDDAVGVRLVALPVTTASVRRGLRASIGAPLEDA